MTSKLFRSDTPFQASDRMGHEYLFQFYLAGDGTNFLVLYAHLFSTETREFVGLFIPQHTDRNVDEFMAIAIKDLCGLSELKAPTLARPGEAPIEAILPLDF